MKKWYLSKTLWVAAIAFVALVVAGLSDGVVTTIEIEGAVTPILMFILRLLTNTSVTK